MSDDPQNSISYMLGQIDAKVTHLLTAHSALREDVDKAHEGINRRLSSHGDRITQLERLSWKTVGILSLIPIAATIVGLWLAYLKL